MSPLEAFGLTDVGLRRANNEDVFLLMPGAGAFAVADGIGGAAGGEVAAGLFADAVRAAVPSGGEPSLERAVARVGDIFRNANREILARAAALPELEGMGCTAELALFAGTGFVLGHVGDSRSYLLRDGRLRRITKDHSVVQEQVDLGLLSEAEARRHALRGIIRRAVGTEESLEVDIHRETLRPGELLLLCSDGLTDMASDAEIGALLASGLPLPTLAGRLVDLAKSGGGLDNITVALVRPSPG